MSDLFPGLIEDARAIVAYIGRESVRAPPGVCTADLLAGFRVDRRTVCPPRRQLQVALVEQHRHGVEVARVGLEPESARFQRNGTAARERVENGRQPVVAVLQHFGVGGGVDIRVFVQPFLHHAADDVEQPIAFLILRLFRRKPIRVLRRVVHHRCEEDGPAVGSGSRAHQWWMPFGCGPMPGILS